MLVDSNDMMGWTGQHGGHHQSHNVPVMVRSPSPMIGPQPMDGTPVASQRGVPMRSMFGMDGDPMEAYGSSRGDGGAMLMPELTGNMRSASPLIGPQQYPADAMLQTDLSGLRPSPMLSPQPVLQGQAIPVSVDGVSGIRVNGPLGTSTLQPHQEIRVYDVQGDGSLRQINNTSARMGSQPIIGPQELSQYGQMMGPQFVDDLQIPRAPPQPMVSPVSKHSPAVQHPEVGQLRGGPSSMMGPKQFQDPAPVPHRVPARHTDDDDYDVPIPVALFDEQGGLMNKQDEAYHMVDSARARPASCQPTTAPSLEKGKTVWLHLQLENGMYKGRLAGQGAQEPPMPLSSSSSNISNMGQEVPPSEGMESAARILASFDRSNPKNSPQKKWGDDLKGLVDEAIPCPPHMVGQLLQAHPVVTMTGINERRRMRNMNWGGRGHSDFPEHLYTVQA